MAPHDFTTAFYANPKALLVDICTPEEFATGHVAGAMNIDFYSPDFIDRMAAVAVNKELYIYCRSGGRSGNAVVALSQAGLTAHDLEGGIIMNRELIEQN